MDFGAGLLIFLSGYVIGDYRRIIPPLPEFTDAFDKPEVVDCRVCGAPLSCAPGNFSALCNYCGAENDRAAFTQAAEEAALAKKYRASQSLYEAMLSLRVRVRAIMKVYFGSLLFSIFMMVTVPWAQAMGEIPPLLNLLILIAIFAFFGTLIPIFFVP